MFAEVLTLKFLSYIIRKTTIKTINDHCKTHEAVSLMAPTRGMTGASLPPAAPPAAPQILAGLFQVLTLLQIWVKTFHLCIYQKVYFPCNLFSPRLTGAGQAAYLHCSITCFATEFSLELWYIKCTSCHSSIFMSWVWGKASFLHRFYIQCVVICSSCRREGNIRVLSIEALIRTLFIDALSWFKFQRTLCRLRP